MAEKRKGRKRTNSNERKRITYVLLRASPMLGLLFLFPLNRAIKSTRPPINDASFVALGTPSNVQATLPFVKADSKERMNNKIHPHHNV